jgi:hypothetical protein
MYSYLASDWASGPLYAAMEEAYDGGFWDPSGYEASPGAFKTDPNAFEVAAKEYLYLLNFSMFDYTSLWEGGSLAPEWSDTVRTQAGILANNPLGYALHNTYIAPVISKPSLVTIRSLFPDGDVPRGWLAVRSEGQNREAVLNGFSGSAEFATLASTSGIKASSRASPDGAEARDERQSRQTIPVPALPKLGFFILAGLMLLFVWGRIRSGQ